MTNKDNQCTGDIAAAVTCVLERYFRDLDGETAHNIYAMVISQVERPMLQVVMQKAEGNQTRAADMLGINRNTLRRKLSENNLL
ncbi:MAG: Fis family transcriptional regulator [Rhodocyclaceae bacterium]|nr:Fis family transcriptional regulator [Rhodocyclaceae bacterium]